LPTAGMENPPCALCSALRVGHSVTENVAFVNRTAVRFVASILLLIR
jgi:hypothetical protein